MLGVSRCKMRHLPNKVGHLHTIFEVNLSLWFIVIYVSACGDFTLCKSVFPLRLPCDVAVLHKVKTLRRWVSKPVTVIPRGFMPKWMMTGKNLGKGRWGETKIPQGWLPCGTRWSNTLEITPINEIIYSPSHFLPLSERSQKLNNNVAAKMHR